MAQPKSAVPPDALVTRTSSIHRTGCYTTVPIKKKSHVVEYLGDIISIEEADRRYLGREHTYLFGLQDGKHVIDGTNVAAFINHSCDPNCEADEIEGHVWIIALRDITAGEELTYDYNLYDGEEDDMAPCSCGAKNCRGTLYSKQELAKRGRAQAIAAARRRKRSRR
jgi:SET domain-containing protein